MSGVYALSEIYDLQMGKTPSRDNSKYWENGNYEWISIADLTKYGEYTGDSKEKITQKAIEESGIRVIPSHTLIMSFKLSIGKVAITSRDCFSNEAIMAFIDKGVIKIIPEYAYYLFLAQDWDKGTNRAVMGATLNKATLSKYQVYIHDEDIQKEIVYKLNKITNAIKYRKRQIEKIDKLVKSQFIEIFGDPEINQHGFDKVTVNDVCTAIVRGPFGSALKKDFFVEKSSKTYKVYEQKHAIQKSAAIGTYYIDETKFKELKRFECKPGDFLMSCSGTMGELYQLPADCERGIINQALCKFTLNDKIVPVFFLTYMSQTIGNLETKGSGIKNIAAVSYVKAMPVILPPIELQNEFAHFVEQTDKSKFRIKQSLEKLEILYKALLQKYFG